MHAKHFPYHSKSSGKCIMYCLPPKKDWIHWSKLGSSQYHLSLSPTVLFFNWEHSSSNGLLVNIIAIKDTTLMYRGKENDYRWDWDSGVKFTHHRKDVLISSGWKRFGALGIIIRWDWKRTCSKFKTHF